MSFHQQKWSKNQLELSTANCDTVLQHLAALHSLGL